MCINIDIVLHHATIKRYFDSFLIRRETLGCVGQKCVRPPNFFNLTGTPMNVFEICCPRLTEMNFKLNKCSLFYIMNYGLHKLYNMRI